MHDVFLLLSHRDPSRILLHDPCCWHRPKPARRPLKESDFSHRAGIAPAAPRGPLQLLTLFFSAIVVPPVLWFMLPYQVPSFADHILDRIDTITGPHPLAILCLHFRRHVPRSQPCLNQKHPYCQGVRGLLLILLVKPVNNLPGFSLCTKFSPSFPNPLSTRASPARSTPA